MGFFVIWQRNEELGTPDSRRDLCASLQRIGDAALKGERLDDAETYYLRLLDTAMELSIIVQTADSMMVLGVALERMAEVSHALGKDDKAIEYMTMQLMLSFGG